MTRWRQNEGDEAAAWKAMKRRRIYFAQEAVLSGGKLATNTIEEIVIENPRVK